MSRNEEAALHTSMVHLGGPFVNFSAKSGTTSVKANSYTCVGITELCKSQCNVYTICRQTQLSTRWYANLLNVNLNYTFRPQSFGHHQVV